MIVKKYIFTFVHKNNHKSYSFNYFLFLKNNLHLEIPNCSVVLVGLSGTLSYELHKVIILIIWDNGNSYFSQKLFIRINAYFFRNRSQENGPVTEKKVSVTEIVSLTEVIVTERSFLNRNIFLLQKWEKKNKVSRKKFTHFHGTY